MSGKDRRQYVRLKTARYVEFTVSDRRYEGKIISESGSGVYIEAKGRFSKGHAVLMKYSSPQGIDITKTGSISRVDADGFGVRFRHPGYAR